MTEEEIATTAARVAQDVAGAAKFVAAEAAAAALLVAQEQNVNIREQSEIIAGLTESVATIAASLEQLAKAVVDRPTWADVSRRLLAGMGLVILLGMFATAGTFWATYRNQEAALDNQRTLLECTTAGPHTPTEEDPTTGHRCYDEGTARTGKAVARIIDSNQNSVPDVAEISGSLGRIEDIANLAREGVERLEAAQR